MGTFMSKHCSPMSYGTPLEKKSCANYGTPLNQGKSLIEGYKKINPKPVREQIDEITTEHAGLLKPVPMKQKKKEHVPAEFKDPNFMKRLESLNPQTKKNIMNRIRKRDSMAIAKHGSIEAMKKMQVEAEKAMTPEQKSRDDY